MPADQIAVVAALIQRRGQLLICQRRADDVLGLKWEFPGGKVQPGENLEAALVRELREELDVSARVGNEVFAANFTYGELPRTVQLHFFAATIPEDALLRNLAFEQFLWVEPHRLVEFDFLPADRELVEKLARGELKL